MDFLKEDGLPQNEFLVATLGAVKATTQFLKKFKFKIQAQDEKLAGFNLRLRWA